VTISREVEAEIARLFHAEHWKVGTIAAQLGVHTAAALVRAAAEGAWPTVPLIWSTGSCPTYLSGSTSFRFPMSCAGSLRSKHIASKMSGVVVYSVLDERGSPTGA
jgi:hypothetical protein